IVLTGAPNLYEYKGKGPLEKPIKVAYAKEGAVLYDGHKEGWELTTLKKTKIRGVESFSMVCSEKELGISEEHEGIIILAEDAPTGMPLADYMGDAVFTIDILPNIARDANMIGVAREIAAVLNRPLKTPAYTFLAEGEPIDGQVSIEITNPEMNARFTAGLIKNIEIKESPAWVRRRLALAGMRPINNIVDATNYVMLDVGEPLHAFDYDVLLKRSGGKAPKIITRAAVQGEKLTTLDDVERTMDDFTTLVCDTEGALAMAGVMGGLESEVTEDTKTVLLEAASWNLINTRKTLAAHKMSSEAAYRFSRGVHPEMAPRGLARGLEIMRQWSGGVVCKGIIDEYPAPVEDPSVTTTVEEVNRRLGINISMDEIVDILQRLEFKVVVNGNSFTATVPDHRLDISDGVVGRADILEEIARIYGYDRIPESRLADELPPQVTYQELVLENRIKDLLVALGLQEIINYRMTCPEREAQAVVPGTPIPETYVTLENPISPDRAMMRQNLLANVLEIIERNIRLREHLAIFELGPVFIPQAGEILPDEQPHLAMALSGRRALPGWQAADEGIMDFFDLKGIIEALVSGLHIENVTYQPVQHPSLHPGKAASIMAGELQMGVFGELHPLVKEQYDLDKNPVLVANLDLRAVYSLAQTRFEAEVVPNYPPVLEDLALVVAEAVSAVTVQNLIYNTGKGTITDVRLFDVYRDEKLGIGQKSLAYSITYQAQDRTLTDDEVSKIRNKVIRRAEYELKAQLRS
ncbi:MAG: phenylalanine--tRNA ligase subunit beta, partial [Anaerolineales bacterium]|nr:phenylalanine--tRNA ligase subunit beta [Anaerolineales bacterium]